MYENMVSVRTESQMFLKLWYESVLHISIIIIIIIITCVALNL